MRRDIATLLILDALRREERRKSEIQHHTRRESEKAKEAARERADDLDAFAASAFASMASVDEMMRRIDSYQAATIIALQKNTQALSEAEDALAELQAQAFTLADGTRVYRTEDGTAVFDENGAEIDEERVTPTAILDHHPKWETFESVSGGIDALHQKRELLLAYQDKLDAAEERLEDGEITEQELADIGRDLEAMPLTVRRELMAGTEGKFGMDVPDISKAFATSSTPVSKFTATDPRHDVLDGPG